MLHIVKKTALRYTFQQGLGTTKQKINWFSAKFFASPFLNRPAASFFHSSITRQNAVDDGSFNETDEIWSLFNGAAENTSKPTETNNELLSEVPVEEKDTPPNLRASEENYKQYAKDYNSDEVVSQLVNTIMRHGKKATAQKYVNKALLIVQRELNQNPVKVLHESVTKISPLMKLVTQKRPTKNIQFPLPLNERQRRRFAIVWMLDASNSYKSKSISERLAAEIIAVHNGTSKCIKQKEQLHRLCLNNRGNAPIRI
ncbi:mitochondrial 37S ribosomal protein RSM7 [Schizosaccharomyces japonicus yFS275]|uniref:Ribosomal protein subunit S7 n=1 Tax=Schizosaccharomyces japonicus (strain yFS275 / FY16936) TaxID=402676 RepID=B6JVU7_SCHJY|nr:mitochondrial 37S ribosomal protein RSM7 [Schizosaccharomyces japonicus yFS275]EEB05498.1 ribosomal protein subunit S7 [Schizosaccharomyces japonicus yFS275]